MKLTIPRQLFVRSTTCYVSSESGGADHIVVYSNGTLFCDCRDFFVRHLPLFGTSAFSLCKHGEFARDNDLNPKKFARDNDLNPKKFVVFVKDSLEAFRSCDIPVIFDTHEAAQAAIDKFNKEHGRYIDREVREL